MTVEDFLGGSPAASAVAPSPAAPGTPMSLSDFAGGNISSLKTVTNPQDIPQAQPQTQDVQPETLDPAAKTLDDMPIPGLPPGATPGSIGSRIKGFVSDINQIGETGGKNIAAAITKPAQVAQAGGSPLKVAGAVAESGLQTASEAVTGIFGSAFSALKAVTPGFIQNTLSGILQRGATQLTQGSGDQGQPTKLGPKVAQQILSAYGKLNQNHPDVVKNLGAVINIATALTGTEAGKAAEPVVTDAAKAASEAIPETVQSAKEALTNHYVTSATEDWTKQGSAFVRSKNILEDASSKDGDIPKFLAQRGISPQSLVKNGKFDTAEIADQLRNDAGKLSEDVSKPALKVADASTPNIPLDTWKDRATKLINDSRGITEGDKARQLKQVESEFTALGKKYPDGDLPVSELDKQKSTYWANTKFALDSEGKVISQTNGAIGTAAKQLVEDTVPNLPVKEMNAHLSQYYKTATFLESLDGKAYKLSKIAKVGNRLAKWGGAVLGEGLTGGAAGGIGGYMLGNTLTHALENASNPLRDFIMKAVKADNPEAYKALQKYIDEEAAAGSTRLALPAPKSIQLSNSKGTPGLNYNLPNEGDLGTPVK